MKCPLLLMGKLAAYPRINFERGDDDCREDDCAWWVPLIKPGPRDEKGACAIHYLGIFGIEKAGLPPCDGPLP